MFLGGSERRDPSSYFEYLARRSLSLLASIFGNLAKVTSSQALCCSFRQSLVLYGRYWGFSTGIASAGTG